MFNSTLSPGQTLIHLLMMHLHSEHFLNERIRNRVLWQESSDFFAWLHKLHSAISLNLSEWGFSNFLPQICFHTEHLSCSSLLEKSFRTTSPSIACTTLHTQPEKMVGTCHPEYCPLRCGHRLLGRGISRLGVLATNWESVCFIHCTSSRSGKSSWAWASRDLWRASPLYRPCEAWPSKFSSSIVSMRSVFPYQVYLSTQFTSLYFLLMSCIRFDWTSCTSFMASSFVATSSWRMEVALDAQFSARLGQGFIPTRTCWGHTLRSDLGHVVAELHDLISATIRNSEIMPTNTNT